jgi:hypothetical protein
MYSLVACGAVEAAPRSFHYLLPTPAGEGADDYLLRAHRGWSAVMIPGREFVSSGYTIMNDIADSSGDGRALIYYLEVARVKMLRGNSVLGMKSIWVEKLCSCLKLPMLSFLVGMYQRGLCYMWEVRWLPVAVKETYSSWHS